MKKIKFTQEVEVKCADGREICVGSVLRKVDDWTDCGVVRRICMSPDDVQHMMGAVGDMLIFKSAGCTTISNKYSSWEHIPHDEQTYEQRFQSWLCRPLDRGYELTQSEADRSDDEVNAINGIMTLLPEKIVDWENGPWPDKIEDALRFLSEHLTEEKKFYEENKREF